VSHDFQDTSFNVSIRNQNLTLFGANRLNHFVITFVIIKKDDDE